MRRSQYAHAHEPPQRDSLFDAWTSFRLGVKAGSAVKSLRVAPFLLGVVATIALVQLWPASGGAPPALRLSLIHI